MLLTQEPTYIVLMVITQEQTIKKIAATHAFQILEWFTVTYHHHVKPSYKAKIFKENQCIVAWGHATSQVGGNVDLQKYHILFIFHIPFITLFLFYHFIKPLISIIFMTKYGLPCYFSKSFIFEYFELNCG